MNPDKEIATATEIGLSQSRLIEAERLQADCHRFITALMSYNPKLTYEAAQSTWLFNKLAEIEISIRQINNSLHSHKNI